MVGKQKQVKKLEDTPLLGSENLSDTYQQIRQIETNNNVDDEVNFLQQLQREVRYEHSKLSWYRRPSLLSISILIVLFCLAEMLYLTPMITLTMSKVCMKVADDTGEMCNPELVQQTLSDLSSKTIILSAIASTIMAGKWGQLSDRIGRVKVFGYMGIIKVIGNFIHLLVVLPGVAYHPWLIIIFGSIGSLSGGMYALVANMNSYIVDIVEPNDRTSSLGILTSVMYGSLGATPMFASLLVKAYHDNAVPIYLAIGSGVCFTILCFTIMLEPRHGRALELSQDNYKKWKETLRARHSYNEDIAVHQKLLYHGKYHMLHILNVLSPLKEIWSVKPQGEGASSLRCHIILLLIIDILFLCTTMAIIPTLILFCTYRYEWRSIELGYFISMSGIANAIALTLLSKFMVTILRKRFPRSESSVDFVDLTSIRFSMLSITLGVLAIIIFGNSSKSIVLYLIFRAFGGICSPTIQSTIVKYYKSKTGQIFGGIALLHALSMVILPPIMLNIYKATVAFKPESFLYVPLVACLLSIILTFFIRPHEDHKNELYAGNYNKTNNEAENYSSSNLENTQ